MLTVCLVNLGFELSKRAVELLSCRLFPAGCAREGRRLIALPFSARHVHQARSARPFFEARFSRLLLDIDRLAVRFRYCNSLVVGMVCSAGSAQVVLRSPLALPPRPKVAGLVSTALMAIAWTLGSFESCCPICTTFW